jgi:hypothetical protein
VPLLGNVPLCGRFKRILISALVLAVGFAAFSKPREGSMTMLQSWQAWVQRSTGNSRYGSTGLFKQPRPSKLKAFLRKLSL